MTEPTATDSSASEPARLQPARGIFGGFEGYRSPSDTDLAEMMRHGLMAADANLLLDLYRYTEQGRNFLLSVLGKLGGQLWIPIMRWWSSGVITWRP